MIATLTARSAEPAFLPGMTLLHYEIIRLLGAGGMGEVYLARDTRLGRLVAIKFLLEHTGVAAERFVAEARTTAQCRHENIVVIYDVGEFEGYPYMVLEYVEGRSLRAAMSERGPTMATVAVDIMLAIARALDGAHQMGIVHRDLKPENVLLAQGGQIKVFDFGIAKRMSILPVQGLPKEMPAVREPIPIDDAPMSGPWSMQTTMPHGSAVTEQGAFVGTMPYMAPEQWLGDDVDARTDIWAAGIILFELLTGKHPLDPLSMSQLGQVAHMDVPMPKIRDKRSVAEPLAAIVDRCLQKHKEDRFPSAKELVSALERAHLDKTLPGSRQTDDESPFTGLSAFQKEDAARFFGRDQDIAAVLGKLRSQQLIVVAGPSGAGKSSFVRAGILPALERAGREMEVIIIRPGRRPLASLADVLALFPDTLSGSIETESESIVTTLRTQPGHLGACLRARCRRRGVEQRFVLFVDQLEELYTLGVDAEERAAFCACLEGVADDASSPLRVIATIRADFLDRVAEDRRFWEEVTRGLVFLPPMTRYGLREAMIKPVQRAGYRFEDEALVDEMLDGLEGTRTPLPILQFAAAKLWELRDVERRMLTRQAHRDIGGVAGALSAHADAVLASLSATEQPLARLIFMALVTLERTRAIVPYDDILALGADPTAVGEIVQQLANARLISIDSTGRREGKTIELTHESLIERWARLESWLDEDEHDAQFLGQVRSAAQQWEKSGEREGFLWREHAAAEARSWFERRQKVKGNVGLGAREQRFLQAIIGLAERTRRWKNRVTASLVAMSIAVVIAVSWLAFEARKETQRADAERAEAQAQRTEAQAQRVEALRSAARARNATRLAIARERQEDPTLALGLLREIESGSIPTGWAALARWARTSHVAKLVFEHDAPVNSVQFSQDGNKIISLCIHDKSVWIRNADGTGTPTIAYGRPEDVEPLAVHPMGTHVAFASSNDTLQLRSVDGIGPSLALSGHTEQITAARFYRDGRRLGTSSLDGTVRIWNTDGSGAPIVLQHGKGLPRVVDFSPDGKRVLVPATDRLAWMQNIDGSGEVREFRGHTGALMSGAFSPDGRRVLTTSIDKTVRIWNIEGSDEPIVLQGHDGAVLWAAWSPDGRRIISVGDDKTLRIWDVDGRNNPVVLHIEKAIIHRAEFSLDGQSIAFASADKTVRIIPMAVPHRTRIFHVHTRPVFSAWLTPDGNHILSSAQDKTARLSKLDQTRDAIIFPHERPVHSTALTKDAQSLVTTSWDNFAYVWRMDGKDKPLVLRGHEKFVVDAQFSRDGRRVITASFDRTARVWNADGSGEPLVLRGDQGVLNSADFSPDGHTAVTGGWDTNLRIWNVDQGTERAKLRGHHGQIAMVRYSPDGRRIASCADDKTIRIWNADGSGEPVVLAGHEDYIASVSWSFDSRRIVSASTDRTVRIWNADGTGEPTVLVGASLGYTFASWSPDDKRIVAASEDNTITVWSDIEPLLGPEDPRLWEATSYCMSLEHRKQWLDFSEEQLRTDLHHCKERVARTRLRTNSSSTQLSQ